MADTNSFIDIKCNECSNTQRIFTKATRDIACLVCDSILAQSTGGKIELAEAKEV